MADGQAIDSIVHGPIALHSLLGHKQELSKIFTGNKMALGDLPRVPEFGSSNPLPNRPKKSSEFGEVLAFFRTIVVFLAIFIVLRVSVVEAYKIPSGSMIPTLRIGDHIFVFKLAYGLRIPIPALEFPWPYRDEMLWLYGYPKRGDVVVFRKPDDPKTLEDESSIDIIKRVMGLPGDTIEVKGTSVYINNQLYPENYARWEENGSRNGNFGPETVPEGHIFLMGDNRDASFDGRFWPSHFLDVRRVKGRAFLIYWSWANWKRMFDIIR